MHRHLLLIALTLVCCTSSARAQTPPAGQPGAAQGLVTPDPAARLTAVTNVDDNASVEAVLLPPSVTRGVFGKAVSDRYAAIQMIVSNRSRDATLIVHSIFIDYSRWLFSGTSGQTLRPCPSPEREPSQQAATSAADQKSTLPECENPVEDWQVASRANQIAAAEYRIPRGTLLDSQPWSRRNWTIRTAELIGSLAAGFVFSFKEANAAKAVAAYNGNFLPALRNLLPDSIIEQANRLSDLGFRVNKVIPSESSDVMVAFFPLDRFLTPGVKELYQQSPSIFFVPHSILFDNKARELLAGLGIKTEEVDELKALLLRSPEEAQKKPAMQLLNKVSLNNIRLIVGGTMSVDVNSIPASIERVEFDEADPAMLWAQTGQKKGTIHGRYLSAGKVNIINASALQIVDVTTLEEQATDQTLRFQFTLSKPLVGTDSALAFRVDKRDKSERVVAGNEYTHPVKPVLLVAPAVDKVERSGDTLTITGQRFFSTETTPLTVTLEPGGVSGVAAKPVAKFDRTPTDVKIDLAPLALAPACWTPQVAVGTMKALGAAAFAQPPAPKITAAKKNGTRIVVTGEQFINLAACQKALTFEIAEQTGAKFAPVTQLTIVSAKEVSFDLPKAPADGKFKIRVLVGGVEADTKNVE